MTRLFGMIRHALMALAILLAAALPGVAEAAEARPAASQKADALLSGLIETNDPGLAVLVAQNGKILFEKGYGLSDREHHVPVISQTIFRIGSITKQFTASAILKLQEEGKLSVTDKLSKYIPDFPRGDEVTLRHLLTHTSGIHDCRNTPDFYSRVTNPITTEATIEELKKQKNPYDFDPEAKWRYNNAGYLLLCYVVEKVSGQSYGNFMRENFFQQLEALGYSLDTNGFKRAVNWDMSWAAGSGALYSTVGDLCRWNEGIFKGRALDATSLKAAFTPVKTFEKQLNSDTGYGFGWFIRRYRGLREISHGGDLDGFCSMLLRMPDEKFTVAILANADPGKPDASPQRVAYRLVDVFLADKLAPLPTVNTHVSPKSYDALTGRYDPGFQGVILTISRRGTHLFAQSAAGSEMGPEEEIFPKSDTEFFSKTGGQIRFVKDSSGKVVKIIGHTQGSDVVAMRMNDSVEEK